MLLETIISLVVMGAITFILDELAQPKLKLPRVGANPGPFNLLKWWARWTWVRHGHDDVLQAYKDFNVGNYAIQTVMGDIAILDPKFLNELDMLPESKLNSTAALVDSVMGQFTGVDHLLKDHLTTDICRGPFTRHLVNFVPIMAQELKAAMAEKLEFDASQTLEAYELLLSFIHRITSVVFVGRVCGQSPIWNHAVTILPLDVFLTKNILLLFPTFLRRFIAPLIPQRNRIFRQRVAVRNLLFPFDEVKAGDEPSVMKFFVESGKDKSPESITARLMILTGAALHTSSMAIAHAVFDLCAMPEYIETLRLEAQTALARDHGEWKLSTIKGLHRLDSFLKESQRLNQSTFRKHKAFDAVESTPTSPVVRVPSTDHTLAVGFNRKVMSPITLSDGTYLPRRAVLAAPGGPMSRDSLFYAEPHLFDGLRFYRSDEEDTVSSTARDYVAIEAGNLSWGKGRFTCPGRWYAAVMIKLIISNLLLEYDITFPPGQKERPLNGKLDTDVHPDFEQSIVFTRRQIA